MWSALIADFFLWTNILIFQMFFFPMWFLLQRAVRPDLWQICVTCSWSCEECQSGFKFSLNQKSERTQSLEDKNLVFIKIFTSVFGIPVPSYSSTKRNACMSLHGWFSGLATHVRFFAHVSDISLENSVCQPNFSAFLILKECYDSQALFFENPALDIS